MENDAIKSRDFGLKLRLLSWHDVQLMPSCGGGISGERAGGTEHLKQAAAGSVR